jgi:hypothetical protein
VLFDPELLTSKKTGALSYPYFEGDVYRYALNAGFEHWIVFDDKVKERPAEFHWFAGPRILLRRLVNRRQRLMATLTDRTFITNKNLYSIRTDPEKCSLKTLLGIINSRLISFLYTRQITQATKDDFPQVTIEDVLALPFPKLEEKKLTKVIEKLVGKMLDNQTALSKSVEFLARQIHHSNRTPCNLAHYLQKDFSGAVEPEILIDDVQRTGFVHAIQVEADGSELTLTATVADKADAKPLPLPVIRLAFKDEALRQFIYARWKQILDDHSRQRKWTKGKGQEAVYDLLVNRLEPLVYFQHAACDNLRTIRHLMDTVAAEAGGGDLAAVEAEIKKLDAEIDQRVYELYGLTPDEIKIVERAP